MPTMAAVDLGAQSGRVALGAFDGETLAVREVHRFPNTPVSRGGSLSWDVGGLQRSVLDGLRSAGRDAAVDSIAVDSWAVDFGLLDVDDQLVAAPRHYRDKRRARAAQAVFSRVPARELYERTGIQLLPINTIFELAAMGFEHEAALERAHTLLLIPDLFHFWLCGSKTSEFTNATTTQCFDPNTGAWASDLLQRLDIPASLFPDVVNPGTRLGPLSPAAVQATGLDRADVVAVATHDTGSAVAAVPLLEAGSVYLSIGTWSLVGVEVERPVIDDWSFAANLTNEGGVDGTFRLLRNVGGLWLLDECRRCWAAEGSELSFDELASLAADAPSFLAFIDPNAELFLEPGDMPARIREFCRESGQREPGSPGEVVRCVLESLALKHAETVGVLHEVSGVAPQTLHVVGGGARNVLLCSWTASAAGLPVLAGPEEATLVGNLLVQAMALGEIGSLREAREVSRASFEPVAYEPEPSAEWQESRERFAELSNRANLKVGA
jgi:rhamnulokinase